MFNFIPDYVFLLVFGFILLIKGGDWFVDAASSIAKRFKLPELLIGATVVSIGTTLPEVMTSAMGAANGNAAVAYGNAIGSIICNSALIAAITIAIKPAKADRKSLIFPVSFL
jgi:cation:H+ antiporter